MNDPLREPLTNLATADATSELEMRVRHRLGGQLVDFHVETTGTGLVLRGRARTYYVKQLAQHAILEATDLPILANEIEVR